MSLIYFGDDLFYTCLETVIGEGHEVLKIHTYKYSEKIAAIANRNSIPITDERISESELNRFADTGCENMLVAAFPRVPVNDKIRAVNVHPALLPEGRGPWPYSHVILNSMTKSGVTLHKVTETIDGGDILLQDNFAISRLETLESLICKCQLLAANLVKRYFADSDMYWKNAISQSGGSYWPRPTDAEKELNWNEGIEIIEKKIRIYGMLDSWANSEKQERMIRDVSAWRDEHDVHPGTVVHTTNHECLIAANDGYVRFKFF